MFSAPLNCARNPPAAFEVEPLASWSRSSRTTCAPASARWKAALTPIGIASAGMGELRRETIATHAGRAARVEGEPLNPPLVPASSFYDSGYAREQGSPGW